MTSDRALPRGDDSVHQSNIFLACLIRIINTLSLFGFAVIMPCCLSAGLGFSMSEWLQIWAVFFFVTIFTNIYVGRDGRKLGWIRQVRWFGCLGLALSSLAFYYLPCTFGHNLLGGIDPCGNVRDYCRRVCTDDRCIPGAGTET